MTSVPARLALLVALLPLPAWSSDRMTITIRTADKVLAATLDDSAAARDFASLLPLSLTLKDYASTEKIADLPRRLATEGAPDGVEPKVGDIAYYAPWGNLALFYKDFAYSRGLVRLGRIEAGIDELARLGTLNVTIERAR